MAAGHVPQCKTGGRFADLAPARHLSPSHPAKFLSAMPSAKIRSVRDNSYQHFAELDEKAFILRGFGAVVPGEWRADGHLKRTISLSAEDGGASGLGLRRG